MQKLALTQEVVTHLTEVNLANSEELLITRPSPICGPCSIGAAREAASWFGEMPVGKCRHRSPLW